nr:immunoglobulin light chain junction region [Macaca mulatta]MOX69205.1 immunoglobulin light chain junction region [Macaca mulatta]MOX70151.1 immunoglobulin light chain junction region [Macaca mulatta]MOX70330.1 immunoglobulin light chain junction region [Macaca mulatta]MOX70417.1 immunoglobulin light chain junction region [Macaca mulatta]
DYYCCSYRSGNTFIF